MCLLVIKACKSHISQRPKGRGGIHNLLIPARAFLEMPPASASPSEKRGVHPVIGEERQKLFRDECFWENMGPGAQPPRDCGSVRTPHRLGRISLVLCPALGPSPLLLLLSGFQRSRKSQSKLLEPFSSALLYIFSGWRECLTFAGVFPRTRVKSFRLESAMSLSGPDGRWRGGRACLPAPSFPCLCQVSMCLLQLQVLPEDPVPTLK